MATVKYDAVCKMGKYTTRDGAEKTRYHKVGVVFESDKGLSLKVESLPVGFDGWISFYEPKPEQSQGKSAAKPARDSTGLEDDIPFAPIGRGISGHAI